MRSLRAPVAAIYLAEARANLVATSRMPQFTIPTILLPAAFYGLFAIAMNKAGPNVAAAMLATFGVYAAIGPAVFGFGAAVAADRESGRLELRRLSPMPGGAYLAAQLAATLAFTAVSLALIYALSLTAGVRLSPDRWALMIGVHLFSAIPFALVGLGIGFRMSSRGAIAAANIAFLTFAVLGGLWMPIEAFPKQMQQIAWALPSFHLGVLAKMAIGAEPAGLAWLHAVPLALLTIAAGLFAAAGQNRFTA